MKYGYKELRGKCKTCYLKCMRCEPLEFNGIERCEYYTEEEKDEIQVRDIRKSNGERAT